MDMTGRLPQRAISVHSAQNCFLDLLPPPLTLHQHEAYQKITSFTPTQATDSLSWNLTPSGFFSVRSTYLILSQGGKTTSPVSSIWKAKVTPFMQLFFFFLLHNNLLTHDVMQKRNLSFTPGCILCFQRSAETALHLFFLCPYVLALWKTLASSMGYSLLQVGDTPMLSYLQSAPSDKNQWHSWAAGFITATYRIWMGRNNRTFRHSATPSSVLAATIFHESQLCQKFC